MFFASFCRWALCFLGPRDPPLDDPSGRVPTGATETSRPEGFERQRKNPKGPLTPTEKVQETLKTPQKHLLKGGVE